MLALGIRAVHKYTGHRPQPGMRRAWAEARWHDGDEAHRTRDIMLQLARSTRRQEHCIEDREAGPLHARGVQGVEVVRPALSTHDLTAIAWPGRADRAKKL